MAIVVDSATFVELVASLLMVYAIWMVQPSAQAVLPRKPVLVHW